MSILKPINNLIIANQIVPYKYEFSNIIVQFTVWAAQHVKAFKNSDRLLCFFVYKLHKWKYFEYSSTQAAFNTRIEIINSHSAIDTDECLSGHVCGLWDYSALENSRIENGSYGSRMVHGNRNHFKQCADWKSDYN